MVQVDLITGFLGSGKTTFMRHYARYMVQQGWNVCILENDFGAVNVDVMLLQDILGDHCDMESISGGCDCDTHQRRMRTKLISLAMQGFDRVIIEPSGIFDVDEFFDILHDEPLDKWYRMGNVIAIVDAKQEQQLSPQSAYLLASETANAGMVVLSRSQLATPAEMDSTVNYLNHALEQNGCARRFGADVLALLPDGLRQTLEQHRELYDMGLHGPDLMFYYKALQTNPVNRLGNAMHEEKGEVFFTRARAVVEHAADKDAALAYALGFVCHFALDSTCHPYVEAYVRESGVSHCEIETEFDNALLREDGYDPMKFFTASHIKPSRCLLYTSDAADD